MHGKYSTILILLFFALMAFFVPQANKMGLGMAGIFYAMIGAGALIGTGALIVRWITRRLSHSETSLGELGSFLAGGSLPPVVDADPPVRRESRALVVASDRRLVQYQDDDPLEPNYGDDDDWYEEWEDEDEDLDDWQEDEEEEEPADYARGYRGSQRLREKAPAWQSPQQRASHKQAAPTSTLLDLAPRLQVDPDQFSSRRMLIAGIPGSGKTNTVRLLCEEWARVGLPFLVIDVDGEYWSLLPALRAGKGMIVGAFNRCGVSPSCFAEVRDEHDGRTFGEDLLSNRYQVVLDVPSYTDMDGEIDEERAASVFLSIVRGMRTWEQSRSIGERIPSMVVLEEAQIWLPQTYTGSTLAPKTLQALRKVMTRTARDGRRRGVGLVVVAHRLAGILKDVLFCDWMILHQPMRNDLKRYREHWPEVHRERLLRLSTGRAIVITPTGTQQEVQFHRAKTRDQGETPGMAALRRNPEGKGSARHGSLEPTPEGETAEETPDKHLPVLPPRQQEAFNLWQQGGTYQSVHGLAKAMKIAPATVREILEALEKKGYIQKNRKGQQQQQAGGDEA